MQPGTQLGHYEILEAIGKGGMGEVWRAHDTKLGREVAIKTLPPEFAQDADRLARFEREAKLLASLNHPNIAAIYGLEEHESSRFLVLELVEGDTLADRLKRGAIPVEESLQLALQIGEALEAAHEKGVIHRDLKPANIKVTPNGKIKVLDFGLAKAFGGEEADVNLSNSPTLSMQATHAGVILGTAAYMSPEQARGEPADTRADIWAFGCVLFEMLTGRPTWDGRTVTDVIAALVAREPEWSALSPALHPRIRFLLERCLDKEPRRRQSHISDVRVDLEKVLEDPQGVATRPPPRLQSASRNSFLPWAAAAMIGLAGLGVGWFLAPVPARPVARFEIPVDTDQRPYPGQPAVSPNGEYLAYTWGASGQDQTLSLFRMDDPEGEAIAEFDRIGGGGGAPFFSPDSEWLAFFSDGQLHKVSVLGGPATPLADAPVPRGADWSVDQRIVFAPNSRGTLFEVSADGEGVARQLTTRSTERGETSHRQPSWLPGASAFLYTGFGVGNSNTSVNVYSLDTNEYAVLIDDAIDARYLPTGHLVYRQAGDLMAVPFDADRLIQTGTPLPVVEGISEYSVSDTGLLVYRSGSAPPRRLAWVSRDGVAEPFDAEPRVYASPRISPVGGQLVANFGEGLWIRDLAGGMWRLLTFRGRAGWPVWTPDGEYLIYSSLSADTVWDIYRQRIGGASAEEPLVVRDGEQYSMGTISADGTTLSYVDERTETVHDVWFHSLADGADQVFIGDPGSQSGATFSPDGRFLAYVSDPSDRSEVYVRSLSGDGRPEPISYDGGVEPLWLPSGEIVYRTPTHMVAVPVRTEPDLQIGPTETLFEDPYVRSSVLGRDYDVTPDGLRFLMIQLGDPAESTIRLNAVVNWFEELKERVPVP